MTLLIGVFGKGGTGKTTISLALALHYGRARVITTDPYPGLRELMPSPPPGIELVEISYDELREDWKREFGEEAYELVASIADVGRDFVDYLSTAPGLVEEYALYRVVKEHLREGDTVTIWDTQGAPGVMSLIRSQLEFYEHLRRAPLYWSKLKSLMKRDIGIDKIIERWKEVARFTIAEIRKARTIIIVNPDKLSIKVGKMLADELRSYSQFQGFVVNRLREGQGVDASVWPILCVVPELLDASPHVVSSFTRVLAETIR